MSTWTTENLRDALIAYERSGRIVQWGIRSERLDREERYFLLGQDSQLALDQERTVSDQQTFVRVEVDKRNDRFGSARKQIFSALELKSQLEALILAAELGDEEKWSYAKKPSSHSAGPNRADPLIWENVAQSAARLEKSLADNVQQAGAIFNSAEIFVARKHVQTELSNGFRGESSRARVYAEVCFSAVDTESGVAEEFMVKRSGARLDQIDFAAMCRESAENAKASLKTVKPEPGKYAVIIHGPELCQLFTDFSEHLNSNSLYLGMPFLAKGSKVFPEFKGIPFRLWIDPELNHAFHTADFDEYGDAQKRLLLVENNVVVGQIADRRVADYLKIAPTTSTGVLVVEPEQLTPEQDLRRGADKVLEILQFSALFSDSQDLSFSSEIRLAKLYDVKAGTVTFIKGGSLSGNFLESFAGVRWSDRKRLENLDEMNGPQSYYGPAQALLSNVNVSA